MEIKVVILLLNKGAATLVNGKWTSSRFLTLNITKFERCEINFQLPDNVQPLESNITLLIVVRFHVALLQRQEAAPFSGNGAQKGNIRAALHSNLSSL